MKQNDIFAFEEAFHSKEKRDQKKLRKEKQSSDRSRFKKTDIEKTKARKVLKKELSRGRVLLILGNRVEVIGDDEKRYFCTVRGFLKNEKRLVKNIVAVGDFVFFSKKDNLIFDVDKRTSILSREDPLTKKEQIIVVNIDQILIIVSVVSPPLKPFLVDRYIIATLKGRMVPIVIINKLDLIEKGSLDEQYYHEFLKAYKDCGTKIIPVSAKTGDGLDELKDIMKGKASCFAGQSGVGKSSLINALLGTHLKVGEVIKKTYKGAHITTHARLLPLKYGGFCIDTPGIKSFGMWNLKKDEVDSFFPDIKKIASKCKFPNCLHVEEPQCAVRAGVENGKISLLRFESYLSLIKSEEVE